MRRRHREVPPVVALALAVLLAGVAGVGLVPSVRAAADPSDVVLVLDFSASILQDATNRNRFGAAVERIADRVDATAADLIAGDTTVSIVQFASRAADDPGCSDLKLLGSAASVARFGTCLRAIGAAYRAGISAPLTKKIGIDTNYVAAMERAATHLPADSRRPAMILFTDGRHDVAGVPVSEVQPARDRLFGARTPFALLPVGMGLDPVDREALASGLEALRIIRDMPACVSGATFEWPQVVFESAGEAGSAVAVALQDATCTFTAAEPTPAPPTPPPPPAPAAVRSIRLIPGDGRIDVLWAAPPATPAKITDYRVRCRTGEADWVESTEGVSLTPKTTIGGLTNGLPYTCEVATVAGPQNGAWTAIAAPVTPLGLPAAPGKPTVEAGDAAVTIQVAPADQAAVSRFHYECSGDGGATFKGGIDAPPDKPTARIRELTNGVAYVCRAFAENASGVSPASALSDAVTPCGSAFECNPILTPILGGLVALLVLGTAAALFALYRGRTTGYVVAVVDVIHTANIGHGSTLGISFVRPPGARAITGIVADRRSAAEIRIRQRNGGRFIVHDRNGRHESNDGEPLVIVDSLGVRHSLLLRAFATSAASEVASRR
ncbi:MAG TPA: fibronectin type III domain-containing protein [Patescibacteria group bacterium]|nr:fibronectin type III domain-containing protein [Patescibacteria group bacterium]